MMDILNSPDTFTPLIMDAAESNVYGDDMLFRIKSNGGVFNSFNVTGVKTQVVQDGLNNYFYQYKKDIGLLTSVILWQKRTIDYQATYTAFLLGSLSEEDFEKESDNFTFYPKDVSPEYIASVVDRIDSLTGLKLDTSDYASYFECNPSKVMEGFRLLDSNSYFSTLLPSPANDVAVTLLDIK